MFARFARTIPATTFLLVLTVAPVLALEPTPQAMPSASVAAAAKTPSWSSAPSPVATPGISSIPYPVASPTIDTSWLPAPGTAAYDPNAPTPQPSAAPQAAATATTNRDGHGAPGHRVEVTEGERLYERTRDDSYLDPLSWNVTAWKSQHRLVVYYKGRVYRTYRAVFGRNRANGTKLYAGDRRTPEGVYNIVEKHKSRRWQWFLGLNYPNNVDEYRYLQMKDAEEVPYDDDGHDVGEGGHIGIHGTDIPILNSGNVDWTTGCISVDNRDIDELMRILPVGTVVIINP